MSILHRRMAIRDRQEARGAGERGPVPVEAPRKSEGTPWPAEYERASVRAARLSAAAKDTAGNSAEG